VCGCWDGKHDDDCAKLLIAPTAPANALDIVQAALEDK
jgi:hypothetical protein